jgi:hypothetical protein
MVKHDLTHGVCNKTEPKSYFTDRRTRNGGEIYTTALLAIGAQSKSFFFSSAHNDVKSFTFECHFCFVFRCFLFSKFAKTEKLERISNACIVCTRRRMSILLDLCFSLVWCSIRSSKLQNVFAGRPIFWRNSAVDSYFCKVLIYFWVALEYFKVYFPLKKKQKIEASRFVSWR